MAIYIIASALSALAYFIYLLQIINNSAVPNPASWNVWVFASFLGAMSFRYASKDKVASIQFYVGFLGCFTIWLYSLAFGHFGTMGEIERVVLIGCCISILVWYKTRKAIYANIILAIILFVSTIPTITGALRNDFFESPLPWCIWTIAFFLNMVNLIARKNKDGKKWWLILAIPISDVLAHGSVAVVLVYKALTN